MERRNRFAAWGAAYLGGAALLVPNTLPIVLSSIRRLFELTDVQMGWFYTTYSAGCLVAMLSAPVWLSTLSARLVALISGIVLVTGFALLPRLGVPALAFAIFLVIGVAAGAAGSVGNGEIGEMPSPAKWFGLSAALQLVIAALYGLVAPTLIEARYGPAAALGAIAVAFAPCVVAALCLGRERLASGGRAAAAGVRAAWTAGAAGEKAALVLAALAFFFYVLPSCCFWIYAEQIGEAKGADKAWIGISISVGIASAALGPLVFAGLARRLRWAALASLVLSAASFLIVLIPNPAAFLVGVVVFNIAWGMAVPAFLSVIRAIDFTNRLYVSGAAIILIANTVAGPPGGLLVGATGYDGLLLTCAVITVAAGGLVLAALRGANVQAPAGPLAVGH